MFDTCESLCYRTYIFNERNNKMLNTFELPEELKFNPVLVPIEHEGISLPTRIGQKIVRDDTNEVLGIVKSRYTPQPFAALWEPLVEGLEESGLDLDDAEIKWSVMNNGARMYADITLKSYNYDRIVGEKTALQMRVRNSVDGSLKYDVSAFIKRLMCSNGQSRIAENTSAQFKHTANTEPEKIGKVAATWPIVLEDDAHLFNHMRNVGIDRGVAHHFLTQNLCLTKTKTKIKTNEKWLGRMMGLWDTYSTSIGSNGYALYNTLTHYGTHVDRDSLRGAEVGNRALRQEQDVQTLVRGKAFKSLIRYDDFEQRLAA
jgi:hypothetical protein|tara:strand:+ start:2239 stop:3186 length:948 start_codon:yes stop_codon:yes gene_type:complete